MNTKPKKLSEINDRELMELMLSNQVRINSRLMHIEEFLKAQFEKDFLNQPFEKNREGVEKTYKTIGTQSYDSNMVYFNDLYNSSFPITAEIDEYLGSANS